MLKAKRKTGLVFFPAFDWAIDPTHPEREERLLYTQDQVFEEGLFDIDGLEEFKPGLVTVGDIQRVHFCVPDVGSVTTESHFISAGGAQTIGRAVLEKKIDKGFALVRPPGHHAMRVVHGARGFCNVNIEAVMIEHLRRHFGIRKVAIVDTDCHHGDGTQDIYWHDPDTLFISIHQDGRTLYPGSGFPQENGGPTAPGTTINIPLPPNTGAKGFIDTIETIVMPVLKDFEPDLVINSAGQDNHFTDPLTNMNFTAQGYARLTEILDPDIAVLEGGYSIEGALPYVNVGIALAMAGIDYGKVIEPDYDADKLRQPPEIDDWIESIRETTLTNWENRDAARIRALNEGPRAVRTRSIHYDTDNIGERQKETLSVCPDCGGALKIESSSNSSRHILAIHIPMTACTACKELGRQWYETADEGSLD
ncbi:MAG: histone deacetylase, partial [Deltaproteobacteria bacterium]|nr:histone deacetylase [Deltaproteobacteria bacterium]